MEGRTFLKGSKWHYSYACTVEKLRHLEGQERLCKLCVLRHGAKNVHCYGAVTAFKVSDISGKKILWKHRYR